MHLLAHNCVKRKNRLSIGPRTTDRLQFGVRTRKFPRCCSQHESSRKTFFFSKFHTVCMSRASSQRLKQKRRRRRRVAVVCCCCPATETATGSFPTSSHFFLLHYQKTAYERKWPVATAAAAVRKGNDCGDRQTWNFDFTCGSSWTVHEDHRFHGHYLLVELLAVGDDQDSIEAQISTVVCVSWKHFIIRHCADVVRVSYPNFISFLFLSITNSFFISGI